MYYLVFGALLVGVCVCHFNAPLSLTSVCLTIKLSSHNNSIAAKVVMHTKANTHMAEKCHEEINAKIPEAVRIYDNVYLYIQCSNKSIA